MLDCYLIVICLTSAHDAETHNLSLFHLLEALQVPQFTPCGLVPIEAHTYYRTDPASVGTEYELRAVWISESGEEYASEDVNRLEMTALRTRVRSQFVRLPPALGSYFFTMEWRHVGDEPWTRFTVRWPLTIGLAPPLIEVPTADAG